MKKLILILGILGLCQCLVQAQDEAVFMHYTISPILVNPGAAGFNETYDLQFNARTQWAGFEDNPRTISARYNGPLGRTFGLGVGVFSESAAQQTRSKLQLDYAFRYPINEDWKVSFGFLTEFQQIRIDGDVASGVFFDPGDAVLDELLNGKGQFDAALGVYGTYRDNTFGGLTFNNLVSNRLSDIAGTGSSGSFFSFYTFNIGHRFMLEDQNVSIQPSMMIRQIRNAPYQMDFNVQAGFLDDQLLAGLSYRAGLGAMGLLLGAQLPNFNLYYSYDLSFQQFQQTNTGSHEVMIALSFKKKDKKNNQ